MPRSVPRRCNSSSWRSSSTSGFSNSSAWVNAIGSLRTDVGDGVGPEHVAEGAYGVVARLDPEPAGPEPDGSAIAVGPVNIERGRARMGRSDPGSHADSLGL